MNGKPLITILLLLFVAGSVAFMVLRETTSQKPSETGSVSTIPPEFQQNQQDPADTAAGARQVVVYYFHGDVRCPTCHKLESYAQEAVQTHFADELTADTVVWKPVNIDQSENTHFVKDYELVTKAVILSDQLDGKQIAFKNLDKIWDLVGDKEKYLQYIQQNLREFYEEDHS